MDTISIIIPAYQATGTLLTPVRSLLAQTYPHWQLLLVADDDVDYGHFLKQNEINDPRIRFLRTDTSGSGPAHTRNLGLKHATTNMAALLDHDDAFAPEKLERCVAKAKIYGAISCALELRDSSGKHLRNIADKTSEGLLDFRAYKSIHYSSETMLIVDRKKCPVFYDESLSGPEDMVFALSHFNHIDAIYHIPKLLQIYFKRPTSLSFGTNNYEQFIEQKKRVIQNIKEKKYCQKDRVNRVAEEFMTLSLMAEEIHFQNNPDETLFEDCIERVLRKNGF